MPANNIVWWWVPVIDLIGTWNSTMQLSLMTIMSCMIGLTWIIVAKK